MNKLPTLIALLAAAGMAHTAPVQYQLTSASAYYLDTNTAPPLANFPTAAPLTLSFIYDAEAAVFPQAPTFADANLQVFAHKSRYDGAISNIVGHVDGHDFAAATAITLIGNSSPEDATPTLPIVVDGVVAWAGRGYNDSLPETDLNGFAVDDSYLQSVTLGQIGTPALFADDSLPLSLNPTSQTIIFALHLIFADASGVQHSYRYDNLQLSVAPVPLPAAFWLFASATGALFGARIRRQP